VFLPGTFKRTSTNPKAAIPPIPYTTNLPLDFAAIYLKIEKELFCFQFKMNF
jgi:hypothetical protein